MIFAVVDLGTNSALLTVAERVGDAMRILHDECTIVRLGQGVDASAGLAPAAKERARECLLRYAMHALALRVHALHVVATAVLRDARDGQAFLDEVTQAMREVGAERLDVVGEIASGEREAALSFRGAQQGLLLAGAGPLMVIDVGGGSSEIVFGDATGRMVSRASLQVGAVRLTERCVKNDPPSREELAEIDRVVRGALKSGPSEEVSGSQKIATSSPSPRAHALAVAGTATTLAAIDLGLVAYDGARVHGHVLSLGRFEALRDRLASLPLEVRKKVPGLSPQRADVIVAGATVLLTILKHYGKPEVMVSDRGLRFGRLSELLAFSPE